MQKPLYATLDDLNREITQLNSADSKDRVGIDPSHGLTLLDTVSRRCDLILSPHREVWFGPVQETRRVKVNSTNYSAKSRRVTLSTPLLELMELTYGSSDWADGATLDDPQTIYLGTGCSIADTLSTTRLEVEGLWGIPDDPNDPWPLTGVALSGDINTTVTELPVDSSALLGLLGNYVFAPGRILEIDDEILMVVSRDVEANVVRVLRGQLGTTSAIHTTGDAVRYWAHPAELTQMVARQAALLYVRRGAFQAELVDGIGITTYPQDLLSSLHSVLTGFQL